ncbi:Protein of unknown function [Evansella caseinilytica]|uniref:DUF2500 domain-containing protein n=1 Tax=Evansella caseinilytica TaxID=1503961 RepID=A0A1H3QUT4_9BACI|nr:DUF2500 domain-containing protein [Evansella caseinilytica]SDZ16758.1 Protein of unknown function [Evansella caseinilytica]
MVVLFGVMNDPFSTSFDSIFIVFFMLVAGVIIFQLVRGVGEWSSNNKQPVLTVNSKVAAKRTDVSRSAHATGTDHHRHHHTTTTYYVTFEVESGDRIEMKVSGKEYGQLAEGDTGKLTFQGTRYQGFERAAADLN